MSNHHDHSEEQSETKDTFFYSGGTGAFTILWIIAVLSFISWILICG